MPASQDSEARIYSYALIKIPLFSGQQRNGVLRFRYQNQQPLSPGQTIVYPYNDRAYEYLNFKAGLPPRRLELNSDFGVATLPNNSVIRSLYNQHKGLVQAIVEVNFACPDYLDDRVAWWKAQVLSSSINGSEIQLKLGGLGYIEGNLLRRVFDSATVPQAAHSLQISIG